VENRCCKGQVEKKKVRKWRWINYGECRDCLCWSSRKRKMSANIIMQQAIRKRERERKVETRKIDKLLKWKHWEKGRQHFKIFVLLSFLLAFLHEIGSSHKKRLEAPVSWQSTLFQFPRGFFVSQSLWAKVFGVLIFFPKLLRFARPISLHSFGRPTAKVVHTENNWQLESVQTMFCKLDVSLSKLITSRKCTTRPSYDTFANRTPHVEWPTTHKIVGNYQTQYLQVWKCNTLQNRNSRHVFGATAFVWITTHAKRYEKVIFSFLRKQG
jgi:hypothetical protein